MRQASVLLELLAVIRGHDDERVPICRPGRQEIEEPLELDVQETDLCIVQGAQILEDVGGNLLLGPVEEIQVLGSGLGTWTDQPGVPARAPGRGRSIGLVGIEVGTKVGLVVGFVGSLPENMIFIP